MNLYEEAEAHYDAERTEADRERAYRVREERDEPKYIVKEMMGDDYGQFFYLNDEGEDVRELAAKAEAQRDAIREEEVEDARNRDQALDSSF